MKQIEKKPNDEKLENEQNCSRRAALKRIAKGAAVITGVSLLGGLTSCYELYYDYYSDYYYYDYSVYYSDYADVYANAYANAYAVYYDYSDYGNYKSDL